MWGRERIGGHFLNGDIVVVIIVTVVVIIVVVPFKLHKKEVSRRRIRVKRKNERNSHLALSGTVLDAPVRSRAPGTYGANAERLFSSRWHRWYGCGQVKLGDFPEKFSVNVVDVNSI